MQDERDILIKKIFPQLRKLCQERAVTWTEVDLRWGITTEQAAEGKVLPLCLEEIHRCRPYFLGLLGERYGWVSETNSIPAELLGSQPWLKQHLQCSVTELEILHGVFSKESMHGHAYFYFRDPKYLNSVPDDKRQDFTAENPEAAGKLAKLKHKIRCARDKQVCELRESYANPEQLGEWILDDFTKLIERLYPKDQTPDPLDQEAVRHEAYARSRRLAFVGREDLLRRLNELCAAPGKPLVLTGESGCGKSALLAEWVARWRNAHPDDLIIQHYIGSTPDSADWQGLVRRILGELKRAFTIADDIPSNPDALRIALHEWSVKAAGTRRVILVLDALNQLANDSAARQLGWLPAAFPTNFRVIVSTLPGESLEVTKGREWLPQSVGTFEDARERMKLLWRFLRLHRKKLNKPHRRKIVLAQQTSNPLFLHALLDELRQFGEHEALDERIEFYLSASGLPELFDRILTRWHDDFGKDPDHPDLVHNALCLIACARFGLSESELLDLLGKNGERLPGRYWTPFYLAAESALALRAGLLNFGHDYLRVAVQKRWLKSAEAVRTFRLQEVDYFEKISQTGRRKLDELPWLLSATAQWQRQFNLLADLDFISAAFASRRFDALTFWAELEQHHGYRMTEAYKPVLKEPEGHIDGVWAISSLFQDAGHINECLTLREFLLARTRRIRDLDNLPGTLENVAMLLHLKGDLDKALTYFQEAEGLLRHSPFNVSLARNLSNQAVVLREKRNSQGALKCLTKAREILAQKQNPQLTIHTLGNLGVLLWQLGDFDSADQILSHCEAMCRQVGDRLGLEKCLGNRSLVDKARGDIELAIRRCREAESICRELGYRQGEQACLGNLANLFIFQEKFSEALELQKRKEAICAEMGNKLGMVTARANQAAIMAEIGLQGEALQKAESAYRMAVEMNATEAAPRVKAILDFIRSREE